MWRGCHTPGMSAPMRVAWPDGGAYLEQPMIVVRVFRFIDAMMADLAVAEAHRTT
jgi:hypothetical protein